MDIPRSGVERRGRPPPSVGKRRGAPRLVGQGVDEGGNPALLGKVCFCWTPHGVGWIRELGPPPAMGRGRGAPA